MESDLIPYQAQSDMTARHALVLAPHADDEVFGCAGAIASHVRRGTPVNVVVLTDGAQYGNAGERVAESRAAAAVLGYGEPEFWNLPDRQLRHGEALVERVAEKINSIGADLLYAPSPWELHPDHRHTCSIACDAARRCGTRVAFYEVGSPLRPNLLLDLGPFLAQKQQAMHCFASQLARQDFQRQINGLNQYRTYTLPRGIEAAEAYLLVAPGEIDSFLPAALAAFPVSAGANPVAADGDAALPLVSVLIRSLDREHLREALDSVALQTWAHIEVLVVAANPGHAALPAHCGPFPLRVVTTTQPLRRSRTANTALAQARGQYLLFLDDDDWLMPGHIARLAKVLQVQPHCKAAYAGVALVGLDGRPLGQVADLPFDAVRQLAGNLMPIHAVLFDKAMVTAGCHFDEELDRFEDWDFWLQLARHTTFAHVPGVSAAYRIHDSSGVHGDAGPLGDPTQLIYRKWQAQWTEGQSRQMMRRVWATEDLEQQLREAGPALDAAHAIVAKQSQDIHRQIQDIHRQSEAIQRQDQEINRQIQQLHQQSQEIHQQIQAIAQQAHTLEQQRGHAQHQENVIQARERSIRELMESSSWRVTAPLRWLSEKLHRKG